MRSWLALAVVAAAGCGTAAFDPRPHQYVVPRDVLEVRWSKKLTTQPLLEYLPQEFAGAAVDDDGRHVFVGSSDGALLMLDAFDGHLVWRHAFKEPITGQPRFVASERAVFVGTAGGGLYSLDVADGHQRWVYRVKGSIASQPTYVDGILYFTTGESRVYAVDAAIGKWKWQYEREPPDSFTIRGHAAPLVLGKRVYVGFSDGYLACLQLGNGEVIWARSLGADATRFMDVDATPLELDGTIYVTSYAGGVFALDPKDGSTKWRYEIEGAGSVHTDGQRLYFSAPKEGLHCLDKAGHLRWRQALSDGGELSEPLLVGGYVLVSSAQSGTYVADARTGRLAQYFAPGRGATAAPVSDGRQVYLLSNGGYFYALRFAKG